MFLKEKLKAIPIVKNLVEFLEALKIPGYIGFSFYDLSEMYLSGIVNGALSSRAGSIAFSFFMALFPFLLFILNLIAFIPIDNFDSVLFNFIELLLPQETQGFFTDIFTDIRQKQRAGLLSSVFLLSIFLTANGVSSIFSSFEVSYHVVLSRSFVRQYLYSMMVGVLLALVLLVGVTALIFFEIFILSNLDELIPSEINWIRIVQMFFYTILIYISVAILYYFGTIEGKKNRFFSPGALMTCLLILITTYLFGIYIDKFSTYNQLYGSIGALLIFLFYIWLNSSVLLLGFELNATLNRLKNSGKDPT
ncbi:MAG: YihY/virulence factor BrkB family protein [Flavobacteriaceae bacterium]|nr:YihY/virulence factor BrkB family protein [Flavobacteriaceae bacterium]MDG1965566.1 YihY/virulence factor BrkB family protein [Flavobacteriaceae bacterium]